MHIILRFNIITKGEVYLLPSPSSLSIYSNYFFDLIYSTFLGLIGVPFFLTSKCK